MQVDDINFLQIIAKNKVYPPRNGEDYRTHGLLSQFPSETDTVHRYCHFGRIAECYTHGLQSINVGRKTRIQPGYYEIRDAKWVYDLVKLPSLIGFHNLGWSQLYKIRIPRPVRKLTRFADVIIVEGPQMVPALANLAKDTPVIYSSHNVEAEVYSQLAEEAVGQLYYSQLLEIEKRAIETSTATICTSERDRELFKEYYSLSPNSTILIAPNAIDGSKVGSTHIDERRIARLRKEYSIEESKHIGIFIGADYSPNIAAVKQLIDVIDEVNNRGLSMHLLILGDVCTSITTNSGNTTLTGFVDDLSAHMHLADIAYNPVEFGGGTNIKLLEYFAHGLPVITTPFGRRGYNLTDREHALVSPISQFSDRTIELVGNKDLQKHLSTEALQFVRGGYTWEVVSKRLKDDILREIE